MPVQLFLHFHEMVFFTDHTEILSSRLRLLTRIHNLCLMTKSLWSWLETVFLDFRLDYYLLRYAGSCLLEGTSPCYKNLSLTCNSQVIKALCLV